MVFLFILLYGEDEHQFGTRIIVISSVRDSNQNLNENPPLITKVSEKQQQFGTSRDWINIIFPFDTNWTSMKIAIKIPQVDLVTFS